MSDPSTNPTRYSNRARAGLVLVGAVIAIGSAALVLLLIGVLIRRPERLAKVGFPLAVLGVITAFGVSLVVRGLRGRKSPPGNRRVNPQHIFAATGVFGAILFLRLEPGKPVVVWALSALLVTFTLHFVVHELGHVIAGTLAGYRFETLSLFGWVLRRNPAGALEWTAFTANGPDVGGLVTMTNRTARWPRTRAFVFASGGAVANLVAALTAQGFETRVAPGAQLDWFCWAMKWSGYFMVAVNLVPLRMGSATSTDGTLLWNLLFRWKSALSHRLAAWSAAGLRARDWPVTSAECIAHARANQQDLMALIFAGARVMDGGTTKEVAEVFPPDFAPPPFAPAIIRRELWLQTIQLEALVRGRVAEARQRLDQVRAEHGEEDGYLRLTDAAVLFAEGRREDARHALAEWNAHVEAQPSPAAVRVGNHWTVEYLERRLAQEASDAAGLTAAVPA